MRSRLPAQAFLIVVFLYGQLATIWHEVTHIKAPASALTMHLHEHQMHDGARHSHDHAVAHRLAYKAPWIPSNSRLATLKASTDLHNDAELERCLIYHAHGCQFAYLPESPAFTGGGYAAALIETESAPTVALANARNYLIRGPPARS